MKIARKIRSLVVLTILGAILSTGVAHGQSSGIIRNEVFEGLDRVLTQYINDSPSQDTYEYEDGNVLIKYSKDRASGNMTVTLPGSGGQSFEDSVNNRLILDFSTGNRNFNNVNKFVGDRLINSYILTFDNQSKTGRLEILLQANVRASANINSSSAGINFKRLPNDRPIIVIDPGHGGTDPGAVNKGLGISEKNLALTFSNKLANVLSNSGYEVIMTRSTDIFIPLRERFAIANNLDADLFISVHMNSVANAAPTGIETLYYGTDDNKEIAALIQEEMIKASGRTNRGIKVRNDLAVLNGTQMPAVLLEMGFISNATEAKLLLDSSYQDKLVNSVKVAVDRYFQIRRS